MGHPDTTDITPGAAAPRAGAGGSGRVRILVSCLTAIGTVLVAVSIGVVLQSESLARPSCATQPSTTGPYAESLPGMCVKDASDFLASQGITPVVVGQLSVPSALPAAPHSAHVILTVEAGVVVTANTPLGHQA